MFKFKSYESISQREDQTTKFWKKNKMFEESIERRPENNRFSFLDGPPFVTGMPHYASLLPRIAKDIIPRYKTMQGYKVRHVWGWDCHGLPIEEKTEKKVGLKNRRDIEKFGINKFIEACRTYVEETSSEWGWYVDKIAEWVDFKGAYRTMDEDYMESVIWVFKQIYDKGLIYEGVKTLLYCTRCGTPVSKFEIAMDDSYADIKDPAITVEFPVITKGKFKGSRLLAWTTTPWTMPSHRALTVDPKETYVEFESKEPGKKYIVAKKRLEAVLGKDKYKVLREFKGEELLGLEYKSPYEYFPPNKNDFKVYQYPGMVHMEEGTGIVHTAVGFGEIDTEMGKEYDLTLLFSVDDEGKFIDDVTDFKGMYVKDADRRIIKDLEERELLFKKETITHRYPYCYRCETPLIQRAQKSWFIDIQKIKLKLLENAKKINWVPKNMQRRFENNIKDAPDWCISRSRYWATAMPLWKCDKCNTIEVFGSKEEIKKRSGEMPTSLHRNGVDHIKFKCKKCNGTMSRIPEVLDCWLESGSMPYGQLHYPFENQDLFRKTFPADYIVEYVAQIRAWFYCMHVVSNIVTEKNSFKNVVVTGVMAGNDGRKMSKSLGNYPDPKETLEKYGGDALRLYFLSSPIMIGEDMNFMEEDLREQVKTVIFPLWNSFKYFTTYADLAKWEPARSEQKPESNNILDQWILARFKNFQNSVQSSFERYEIPPATREIAPFLNDLSTWYIRRSRDRFVNKDKDALATLYYVLVETCKSIAPIVPLITEEIYQTLVVAQDKNALKSIHFCDYPEIKKINETEKDLLEKMEMVRTISSLGQAARVASGIKVRQPLNTLRTTVDGIKDWMKKLIQDELNIKEIQKVDKIPDNPRSDIQVQGDLKVQLDTKITDELRQEGLMRELVRAIQATRKKSGFNQEDKVKVAIDTTNSDLQKIIVKKHEELENQTNSKQVKLGLGKKEVRINDEIVKISLTKAE